MREATDLQIFIAVARFVNPPGGSQTPGEVFGKMVGELGEHVAKRYIKPTPVTAVTERF